MVDGFYDGEANGAHMFRARFAPMFEGEWHYAIRSNELALCGEGTFQCTTAVSSGSLTIDPRFGNWSARADGTFTMINNEGWYPHAGNGKKLSFEDVDYQQPSEADIKTCCGNSFASYSNRIRKYCSHSCYIQLRFHTAEGNV